MTFIFIHLLCGVLVWKFLVWETTTIEGSDVTLKDYLWAPVVILFGIFGIGLVVLVISDDWSKFEKNFPWMDKVVHKKK